MRIRVNVTSQARRRINNHGLTAVQSARESDFIQESAPHDEKTAVDFWPHPGGGGAAAQTQVLLSMFLSLIVNDRDGANVCAAALPCLNA